MARTTLAGNQRLSVPLRFCMYSWPSPGSLQHGKNEVTWVCKLGKQQCPQLDPLGPDGVCRWDSALQVHSAAWSWAGRWPSSKLLLLDRRAQRGARQGQQDPAWSLRAETGLGLPASHRVAAGTQALALPPLLLLQAALVVLCDSPEHKSCPCFPPPPPAYSFLYLGGKRSSLLSLPLSCCFLPTKCAENNDQMGILAGAWG